MPRRKDDSLTPIEVDILSVGAAAAARGETEFHGFGAARAIAAEGESRRLAATGTVYRALHRLEQFGFLESRWEELAGPRAGGRPTRKLYRLTAAGEAALAGSSVPARRRTGYTPPEVQPA